MEMFTYVLLALFGLVTVGIGLRGRGYPSLRYSRLQRFGYILSGVSAWIIAYEVATTDMSHTSTASWVGMVGMALGYIISGIKPRKIPKPPDDAGFNAGGMYFTD